MGVSIPAAAEPHVEPGTKSPPTNPPQDEPAAENNPEFHALLLETASTYQDWGRVDDQTRWAPYLCKMPNPSQVRFSKSDDNDTHGQKLYYLFAKDRNSYVSNPQKTVKAGQIVVKQSWHPEKVEPPPDALDLPTYLNPHGHAEHDQGGSHHPYTQKEGLTYKASALTGLYVMAKLDPKTPGTDKGWVYGTLSADGKTVTSSGRVASCMGCHTKTEGDRLFGLRE